MSDQRPANLPQAFCENLLFPLAKSNKPRADNIIFPEMSFSSLDSDDYFRSNKGLVDVGHFFIRKLFKKQTYCHHCTDTVAGLLTNENGFVCQDGRRWNLERSLISCKIDQIAKTTLKSRLLLNTVSEIVNDFRDQ
ncbi:hypothetical protein ACOME3_005556 [Neoechinorhynchus agilis]